MSHHSSCPESWHHWGDSCYRITDSNVLWSNAGDECGKLDGVLAAPSSSQENNVILDLIENNEEVWIDCNDLEVEGTWECKEGNVEVSYRNGGDGEPNNYLGNEHCALISKMYGNRRQWLDGTCDMRYSAVCKVPRKPILHV
ncbi:galactose-specific lectin nattectin-like [Asterias rubens]|uniref:galactose-specific lectin nattectin-like n=1 Tax=Asterias rubens TaxID=7604 RepID=UPI001454F77A|nr:galactose-specific lectin nattectin-like [Asterias rubens]